MPASVPQAIADEAIRIAESIATAFDYVGVLAVEMFVLRDGTGQRVLVNEVAPRVHNSGHWTIDGCTVSQFEQHIRAVAGWPLAQPIRLGLVEMTNLIGAEADDYARVARPCPARHRIFTARAKPSPAARWGMSRGCGRRRDAVMDPAAGANLRRSLRNDEPDPPVPQHLLARRGELRPVGLEAAEHLQRVRLELFAESRRIRRAGGLFLRRALHVEWRRKPAARCCAKAARTPPQNWRKITAKTTAKTTD